MTKSGMPTLWLLPIHAPLLLVLMMGLEADGCESLWLVFLREHPPGYLEIVSPGARLL